MVQDIRRNINFILHFLSIFLLYFFHWLYIFSFAKANQDSLFDW